MWQHSASSDRARGRSGDGRERVRVGVLRPVSRVHLRVRMGAAPESGCGRCHTVSKVMGKEGLVKHAEWIKIWYGLRMSMTLHLSVSGESPLTCEIHHAELTFGPNGKSEKAPPGLGRPCIGSDAIISDSIASGFGRCAPSCRNIGGKGEVEKPDARKKVSGRWGG